MALYSESIDFDFAFFYLVLQVSTLPIRLGGYSAGRGWYLQPWLSVTRYCSQGWARPSTPIPSPTSKEFPTQVPSLSRLVPAAP